MSAGPNELPVIVVATEPDASILSAGFKAAGRAFKVMSTPVAAVDEVQSANYAAVVIDESMLPANRPLFFQAIRDEGLASVIVVGWGEADARTEVLLDGADVYLTRPVPDDVLVARVRSLGYRLGRPKESVSGSGLDVVSPPEL